MDRINTLIIEAVSAELRDMLGEDFDPETFWDTLDGETNALDIADALIAKRGEAKALAAAAKAQADELAARASRIAERSRACDAALLTLLRAAGEKRLERPGATISRRSGSVRVVIDDETDVPTQLCKIVQTPDKTAIKKQIDAGETVPGARLERGPDGVTVRVA